MRQFIAFREAHLTRVLKSEKLGIRKLRSLILLDMLAVVHKSQSHAPSITVCLSMTSFWHCCLHESAAKKLSVAETLSGENCTGSYAKSQQNVETFGSLQESPPLRALAVPQARPAELAHVSVDYVFLADSIKHLEISSQTLSSAVASVSDIRVQIGNVPKSTVADTAQRKLRCPL